MPYPNLEALIQTIAMLRDPQKGCPWDLKQNHKSLLKYLIEETYEFTAACEDGDTDEMEDELGDILLQVLLHSQIGSENGSFDIESVAKRLNEKMIRRHPHVFEPSENKIDSDQVKKNWETIKSQENKDKNKNAVYFDSSYLQLPSLMSASKIGKKTKRLSFDWEDPGQVSYKVEEEWQELKEELASYPNINKQRVYEELGDFLFSSAQLARHLDMDPEQALRDANKKFINRFHKMTKLIIDDGKSVEELNQEQMDHYWVRVKHEEK
jgi:MazG family protein